MGPLPRTHGMLGAMLETGGAYRTADIHATPASAAGGRARIPTCARSWASPSSRADEVIGAFYLTEKDRRRRFDDADQELIELLAAHAAIAITNARLYERSRELSILSERNRLALELHDAVSQKLFSLTLTAEAAADAARPRPGGGARAARAGARLAARGAGRAALADLRAAPAPISSATAWCGALRKQVDDARPRPRRRGRARRSTASGSAGDDGARRGELCGSRRRRSTTRSATPAPHTSRCASSRRRALHARGHRRRRRLRPRRPGAALPAPRTDLDGGAGARARRPARAPLGARARARPSAWRSPP